MLEIKREKSIKKSNILRSITDFVDESTLKNAQNLKFYQIGYTIWKFTFNYLSRSYKILKRK